VSFFSKKKPAPAPERILTTEEYRTFARESPWSDQGKDFLLDADAFRLWVKRFRPDKDDKLPRGLGFEVLPPSSYPAIVIHTRIRRTGLTECEFYWDYVTLSDFPSASESTDPSTTDEPNNKEESV
jgi:hypothetical protein